MICFKTPPASTNNAAAITPAEHSTPLSLGEGNEGEAAPNTLMIMSTESKKETWKLIINMVISILTAIATTFGLTSCMGW